MKLKFDENNHVSWVSMDPLETDYTLELPEPIGDPFRYKLINGELSLILEPIPIIITMVTGAVKHTSDFTWITCILGKDIDVEFDLAIGEARTFAMTLSGQRNTPDAKFFAIVDEFGKGKVTLNFDAMGDYVYTNVEANKGLDVPLFNTKDILIEVGKATGLMIDSGA